MKPPRFSSADLCELLDVAFSHTAGAPDPTLVVAVRACRSERIPIGEILQRLFAPNVSTRSYSLKRVFRALARLDQLDALAGLLDHESPHFRLAVIHAYYNVGAAADAPVLERALADADGEVRASAREAIDAILASGNVPRARLSVDDGLSDTDLLLAHVMLRRPVEDADVAALVRLLADDHATVRGLARDALQADTARAHDALLDGLEAQIAAGAPISEEAVALLQQAGGDRDVSLLIRALGTTAGWSPEGPASALEALGARAAPQLLAAFVRDTDVRRRWGALVARIVGADATTPLLQAFESPYEVVRQSAAEGLLMLGADAVRPLLDRLDHVSPGECADILRVLGQLGLEDAFDRILQRATDPDTVVRIAAIRALAAYDRAEATQAVAQAIRSPHWKLRQAAAEAIRRWHWRNHQAMALLNEAIDDPHPRVSAAAAGALTRLAREEGLEDHIARLLQILAEDDDVGRARVREEIADLRGVVAFYFGQARMFSPEGSAEWHRFVDRVKAVADLAPFKSAVTNAAGRYVGGDPAKTVDPISPGAPAPILDHVRFSVTCPVTMTRGQACALDVWVDASGDPETIMRYMRMDPQARGPMGLRSKGPVPVARGTTLAVRLEVASLRWSDEDTVYWSGELGNATFSFVVPDDASDGSHAGTVHIAAVGLPIARVAFLITVAGASGAVQDVTAHQRRISSAFASYAAEDRHEVLARIQGMQRLAPMLDIFFDVMSLRSGDRWEERLQSEIAQRDVLYLFWSNAARCSPWVDREWRIALQTKGLDGIDPVPIEPPDVSPPPPELASLHFNAWTLELRQPERPPA